MKMEVKFTEIKSGIERAIKPPIYLYRVGNRIFTTLSEAKMCNWLESK